MEMQARFPRRVLPPPSCSVVPAALGSRCWAAAHGPRASWGGRQQASPAGGWLRGQALRISGRPPGRAVRRAKHPARRGGDAGAAASRGAPRGEMRRPPCHHPTWRLAARGSASRRGARAPGVAAVSLSSSAAAASRDTLPGSTSQLAHPRFSRLAACSAGVVFVGAEARRRR
eukprot:scaffold527_cov368-Prasinococcus_capsulatus_cf.AAC.6